MICFSWIRNSKNDQLWTYNYSACGLTTFIQLNFNKLCPIDIPNFSKTVEITYSISKRRLCKECVGRKIKNAPGVKSRWHFAFPSSLLLPALLEPAIQSINQYLVSSELKKKLEWRDRPRWAFNLNPWYNHVILVRLADTLYWSTYGNGDTLLYYRSWRTDVRTYVRIVTWRLNFSDPWVTKFSKALGSARASGAQEPLKRTLHVLSKIWILCSRGKTIPCHPNIKSRSSCHPVINIFYAAVWAEPALLSFPCRGLHQNFYQSMVSQDFPGNRKKTSRRQGTLYLMQLIQHLGTN